MTERKLATVQIISGITPIEGADKIEVAQVLGWQCVIAKKDNFEFGDKVVYIEIDSIVPERKEFEFLRDRKFRVKTIKLRKQISQGLVVPLSILPNRVWVEGDDVTEILGIKKYDTQIQEEADLNVVNHRSKIMKYLMRFAIVRKIYLLLNRKEKGNWPQWIKKTDEERIQTCAKLLIDNFDKDWSISEKLDGQSGTFFLRKGKKWGVPVWQFGVCSRNIWLKTPDNSNYWNVANKYNIEKKMRAMGREIIIQGEIIGPNVQKNKYKVTDHEFYVFTIVIDGERLNDIRMRNVAEELGLPVVPLVDNRFNPKNSFGNIKIWAEQVKDVVKEMVNLSIDKTKLASDTHREGIVCRLVDDPKVSFKVINPEFLLKHGD